MSYLGPFDNNNPPTSLAFSDTQVGLVRRYLRWDVQLDTSETNKIKPGATISNKLFAVQLGTQRAVFF